MSLDHENIFAGKENNDHSESAPVAITSAPATGPATRTVSRTAVSSNESRFPIGRVFGGLAVLAAAGGLYAAQGNGYDGQDTPLSSLLSHKDSATTNKSQAAAESTRKDDSSVNIGNKGTFQDLNCATGDLLPTAKDKGALLKNITNPLACRMEPAFSKVGVDIHNLSADANVSIPCLGRLDQIADCATKAGLTSSISDFNSKYLVKVDMGFFKNGDNTDVFFRPVTIDNQTTDLGANHFNKGAMVAVVKDQNGHAVLDNAEEGPDAGCENVIIPFPAVPARPAAPAQPGRPAPSPEATQPVPTQLPSPEVTAVPATPVPPVFPTVPAQQVVIIQGQAEAKSVSNSEGVCVDQQNGNVISVSKDHAFSAASGQNAEAFTNTKTLNQCVAQVQQTETATPVPTSSPTPENTATTAPSKTPAVIKTPTKAPAQTDSTPTRVATKPPVEITATATEGPFAAPTKAPAQTDSTPTRVATEPARPLPSQTPTPNHPFDTGSAATPTITRGNGQSNPSGNQSPAGVATRPAA